MNDLLIRLLELFSQFSLKVKSITENIPRSAYKNSTAIVNLGKLLPIIGTLVQRISTKTINESLSSKLQKLFRDFWFFCVIFGFTDQPGTDETTTWYKDVSIIATKSPLLLSHEHLRSELNFNSAISNDQVSQSVLVELRNVLLGYFDQPEAVKVINYLTFIQCSYVLSVFKLETLR